MSTTQTTGDELQDLVGRIFDGRYRLEKFVDRGGFGAVYRAMDIKFEKVVAIKVGSSLRELKKEAVLAGQVQHDHVVQVTDYGNDGGLAFMVMEFLNGQNLEALLTAYERKLPGFLIRKFVQEVGDALIHAHSENLIHRDLKPRNIILKRPTSRGASSSAVGKFVLLDFGIAAKLDATGTMANRTMTGAGTVEYMAPELLGRVPQATTQTDIYAFGIVLYQMLTGRVPFPQEDNSHLALAECLRAISTSPPPPLATSAPDRSYPPAIDQLVRQCLDKDPTKRPPSMEEVCRRFLADFPHEAPDGTSVLRPGTADAAFPSGASTHPPTSVPLARRLAAAAAFAVVVVCVATFVAQFLRPNGVLAQPKASLSIEAETNGESRWDKLENDRLEIIAGETRRVYWTISGLPADEAVKFEPPAATEGLETHLSSGTDDHSCILSIKISDVNSNETEHALTLRATVPSRSIPLELPLTVVVRKPQPWLANHLEAVGFRVSRLAHLHKVGDQVFAISLERTIGSETVKFRLVTENGELGKLFPAVRSLAPFYIMESPVSNTEFATFALEHPEFEDEKRPAQERTWNVRDDLPVTDISAVEAQRFAEWLAPGHGALPSRTEWDVASGYYDFLAVARETIGNGSGEVAPAKLKDLAKKRLTVMGVEVWLGKGPHECEYNGEPGRSPYGCRYVTRPDGFRLYELTGSVTTRKLTEEYDLRDLLSAEPNKLAQLQAPRVWCRGPASPKEDFSFVRITADGARLKSVEDFNDDGSSLPLPSGQADLDQSESPRRDGFGFRVVLRTVAK